jgi:hypothetical protein
MTETICQWFTKCGRPATGVTSHPILGEVPTCARCRLFATEPVATRPRTKQELFEAAFPPDEDGRRPGIDFAIPQPVFDSMKPHERQAYVGWIYDGQAKIFGRLLTIAECERRIVELATTPKG